MSGTRSSRIKNDAARFHHWMFAEALPFWATRGSDQAGRGFHEALMLDGSPADTGFKRMRVQARQIYSFSHAAMLGWTDGSSVAREGFDFIRAHGWRDEGGWARRLGPGGGIVDSTADLYDNAFVLFALAWYARATGSDEALSLARRTLDWVLDSMRADHGGFANTRPAESGFRQQNPHMHLLEAVLALYGTAPDAALLDVANELVGLFRRHFLAAGSGTLAEFFADDWSPAPGDAGSLVEPGHHYEWVWLLGEYQSLSGENLAAEAETLYRFAERFGRNTTTGLIVNQLGSDGSIRDGAARLWPQTEELKAHLAMSARSGQPEGEKISRVVHNLFENYLNTQPAGLKRAIPAGTWIDVFGADGTPQATQIPASSLYHIFVAFAELERAAMVA
jgi:mannose-6-phosphate isomerase